MTDPLLPERDVRDATGRAAPHHAAPARAREAPLPEATIAERAAAANRIGEPVPPPLARRWRIPTDPPPV